MHAIPSAVTAPNFQYWLQVAVLHKASGSMLAGDVFTNIFGKPPALRLSPEGANSAIHICQYRCAGVCTSPYGVSLICWCALSPSTSLAEPKGGPPNDNPWV